jgi:hypothetical protein
MRQVASILRRPLVKIWALPANVGLPVSWTRCRDSHVVGRWGGRGEPKCSPLALLMVGAGVAFHLFLGRWVGIGRSVGRKLSRLWCQRQHRRRLRASWPSLEALCWDASCFGLCLPSGNISSILRRSADGSISTISFLRASLWKSWAFVTCGAVSSWRWKIGRSIKSLVFFFFIVVVVFSFFLFTSVRGLGYVCSFVIVDRIYPLVGIEAGSISFI